MPMIEAMKEAIWLQGLLDDLGIDQDLLKINCDNISAIYLAKNQVYHVRMKHIDVSSTLFERFLMKVTSSYRKFTQWRIPLIFLPRLFCEKVCTLQRVILYPSSCVSSVEPIWMNYVQLNPVGHEYVGNLNGAAKLESTWCYVVFGSGGELQGERVNSC